MSARKMKNGKSNMSMLRNAFVGAALLLSTNLPACYSQSTEPAKVQPKQQVCEPRQEERILHVLTKYKPMMQSIYLRVLKRDPTLAGKLEITLEVNKDGVVEEVHFKGKRMNEELNQKLERLLKRVKFDPLEKESQLRVPITLVCANCS